LKPILKLLALAVAVLGLTVPVVMAQTTSAPPAAPGGPGAAAPAQAPAPTTSSLPQEKFIQGPVKTVDPMGKTVQVGWFLGLLSTTLAVTDETQIAINGAKASLQDIREGDRVKASYEAWDDQNIAKSIEVTSAAQKEKSRTPSGTPAPQ
jgi:Cu/Ag efflux protein CusF